MCGAQHGAWYVVSSQQTSAVTDIVMKLPRWVCACVHPGLTHRLLVFVFLGLCMSAHTCACGSVPFTLYARARMSLSLCAPMDVWICGTVTVVLLLRTVSALVPVRGGCSRSALAGQRQQVPRLGGCGGAPSPRGWLPGQEGYSVISSAPSPPSVPSPSAPPIQVVSGPLSSPSSQSQVCLLLSFLACPLLPLPPCPRSILHGRPQCPPWLLSGPALMPCLFPSRWEQVLRVGSKPA